MGLFGSESFVVSPGLTSLVWPGFVLCAFIGAGVTIAKGRWGWALVGLLTGGLGWILTAFLIAAPGSLWARTFYGSEKLARSVAKSENNAG